MRFDDDASTPPSDDAGAAAPGGRTRRRAARPWSNPATSGDRDRSGLELPASDSDWKASRPPLAPPVLTDLAPPASAGPSADLGPIAEQLAALQAQVSALQAAVMAPPASDSDAGLVTGVELAAAIEGLGTALGGGMATLLTEHRNLLARDVSSAADRILEEVGVRLRTATTQTVENVEERSRHVVSRALGDLSEQVDLRLDKLQADVSGLRAVMLEIPDQSAVTDRLDQLAEAVTASRTKDGGRVSPALAAAIERSVAAPLEQLEGSVNAVVEVVREMLDERLPDGIEAATIDAATIEALTAEMTALRRRISLRTQASGDEINLDALAEAVHIDVEPPPPAHAPKVTGRRGKRGIG